MRKIIDMTAPPAAVTLIHLRRRATTVAAWSLVLTWLSCRAGEGPVRREMYREARRYQDAHRRYYGLKAGLS